MSEPIITKQCPLCKQTKLVSNFYKNRSTKDGYQCYCIPCHKNYIAKHLKTDSGRLSRKSAQKKYRKSAKGKTANKRYAQSNKGKKRRSAIARKFQLKHPEQTKARNAVRQAIKDGILLPSQYFICSKCNNTATHYHHPSYSPDKLLVVIPVCAKCHKHIHLNRL